MILNKIKGMHTVDGAGVHLVRVLGNNTVKAYDPFLMLDSFDSTNYDDYKAGFPKHPHRGIETLTYLSKGHITHKDSLGNEKTITDGSIQRMTAGSGVYHSETFNHKDDRLLGLQLRLNLKSDEKMTQPQYREITIDDVNKIETDDYIFKIYAGEYDEKKGLQAEHNPLDYFVINLKKGKEITMHTKNGYANVLFTLLGDLEIDGEKVDEKTAVRLEGEKINIKALNEDAEIVRFASPPINEEVARYGPVVMNTKKELYEAFSDMENGNFVRDAIDFED